MKFWKFRNRYISSTTAKTKKNNINYLWKKPWKEKLVYSGLALNGHFLRLTLVFIILLGLKVLKLPYFTDYFWYLLVVCRQCRKLQIFTNNLTLVTDKCCKLWLIFTDAFAMSSDNYWNLWDELSFSQHWQHNISHYKILSVQITLSVYLLEKA